MGIFERYLSLWVALGIITGVLFGQQFPVFFESIAAFEFAHVNGLVAVFIWMMIYPMMVQVDFSSISRLRHEHRALSLTLVVNWLIKPFTMALLGWVFFKWLFAGWVDPQTADEFIAGMILLGVAPCTAMVFIWSQLVGGNANYTLIQVSLNDLIMIVAFAPLAGLLLGVTDLTVPWATLLMSVLLYVLLPLTAGYLTRRFMLRHHGEQALTRFLTRLKPVAIAGLLATVIVLFALQAPALLAQPLVIVMIAVPLLLQTYGIFALAYFAAHRLRLPHELAAPACLIGTSNFFEMAVAVAIALFGLHSGAALATVVGVLVEVPVMLSLVALCNRYPLNFPVKQKGLT